MSKYERLIIYPLLFIALFCALTGVNMVNATQQFIDKIVAKEIVVINDAGDTVASLKYDQEKENVSLEMYNGDGVRTLSLLSYDDGGAIGLFNREGYLTTAIQNDGQAGTLHLYNGTSKETKLVGLRSGLYGGVVEVNNARGLPTAILGNNAHNNGYLGLFRGELLGFLSPQIILNVGETEATIETAKK
jgi:hypothetical protein